MRSSFIGVGFAKIGGKGEKENIIFFLGLD
jgi:hypothetical protein